MGMHCMNYFLTDGESPKTTDSYGTDLTAFRGECLGIVSRCDKNINAVSVVANSTSNSAGERCYSKISN